MNKQHITKDVFLERLNEKYSEKSHMLIPISTIMIKIKGLIVKMVCDIWYTVPQGTKV